jgi:hypothetical protein
VVGEIVRGAWATVLEVQAGGNSLLGWFPPESKKTKKSKRTKWREKRLPIRGGSSANE